MIRSTRISWGYSLIIFYRQRKLILVKTIISAINKIQHSHCSPFYGFYGTQKLKAQGFFIFSLLLTLIYFALLPYITKTRM